MKVEEITLILSIIGAVTGVIALAWNIISFFIEPNYKKKERKEAKEKLKEKILGVKIKQRNNFSLSSNTSTLHVYANILNKCQRVIHIVNFNLLIIDKNEEKVHQLKLNHFTKKITFKPNESPSDIRVPFIRDEKFKEFFPTSSSEYKVKLLLTDIDGQIYNSNAFTPKISP